MAIPFRDRGHPVLKEIESQAILNPSLAAAGVSEPEVVSHDVLGRLPHAPL